MRRASFPTRLRALADARQVKAIASTESRGRDDLIVRTAGIDLTNFRRNPVCLYQHDPDRPIARAIGIAVNGTELTFTAQFPPEGASRCADETLSLIQAGVLSGISIGFDARETEPDPDDRGVMIVTRSELDEISFVSIPALPDALVTERSLLRGAPRASRSGIIDPLARARELAAQREEREAIERERFANSPQEIARRRRRLAAELQQRP